jgi:hypothetical protein
MFVVLFVVCSIVKDDNGIVMEGVLKLHWVFYLDLGLYHLQGNFYLVHRLLW